jgi:hypothetical protein
VLKRVELSGRRAPVLAVLALTGMAVTLRWTVLAGDAGSGGWRLATGIGVLWLLFTVGVTAVRRTSVRIAVPLLVVGGVALQLVAMSSPPRLTDDFYRYTWDGRAQAAGISPYRYLPTDPALARLRTDWLFPPGCTRTAHDGSVTVCTRMNHPDSPTIYPPVAQAEFLAVHVLTEPFGPDGGRDQAWQVLAALLATATTVVLIRVLRRRGDPRQAVLWAWCPTVLLECGGNGHVDASAALLTVLSLVAATWGRRGHAGATAGVLAAAAVATKLLPVLALPALLAPVPAVRAGAAAWRAWLVSRRALLAAGLVTLLVAYLPHLLAVGPGVLGFLPAYLPEEGYDGGGRFPLLHPWVPASVAPMVAVLLLGVVAVGVARRGDPQRPWTGAMVTVGLAFALLGISYPWYALLLVPLVALDGRGAWLGLAAAAYPAYLAPGLHWSFALTSQLAYLAALALLAAPSLTSRVRLYRPGAGPRAPEAVARAGSER